MTDNQKKNLAWLALYVASLPDDYEHFDMTMYSVCDRKYGWPGAKVKETMLDANKCGTSACLAGHGPSAGIAPRGQECWSAYIYRAFGTSDSGDTEDHDYRSWKWLFSSCWDSDINNAAKRAAYVLEHGLPKKFTHSTLPKGFDSYEPKWYKIMAIALQ